MLSLTAACKLHEAGVGLSASSASLGFIPPGDKRKEGRKESSSFPQSLVLPSIFPASGVLSSRLLVERRMKRRPRGTPWNAIPLKQMPYVYVRKTEKKMGGR